MNGLLISAFSILPSQAYREAAGFISLVLSCRTFRPRTSHRSQFVLPNCPPEAGVQTGNPATNQQPTNNQPTINSEQQAQ